MKPTNEEIDKWANEYSLELLKRISKKILKPESWIDESKLRIFANGLKVGAKAMRDNLI